MNTRTCSFRLICIGQLFKPFVGRLDFALLLIVTLRTVRKLTLPSGDHCGDSVDCRHQPCWSLARHTKSSA